MSTYETRSRSGTDGRVVLILPPELSNQDVRIRVEPISGNGATSPSALVASPSPSPPRPARDLSRDEWHALIDRMSGSMPDFPDIERPRPDEYERRSEWP